MENILPALTPLFCMIFICYYFLGKREYKNGQQLTGHSATSHCKCNVSHFRFRKVGGVGDIAEPKFVRNFIYPWLGGILNPFHMQLPAQCCNLHYNKDRPFVDLRHQFIRGSTVHNTNLNTNKLMLLELKRGTLLFHCLPVKPRALCEGELTALLMEPGGSMPHSLRLSNNPYPEPNKPNSSY